MSFDETINAYFVTSSAGDCSDEISNALTLLRNHVPEEHIREIKACEGFPLIATGRLTKKDVFIFDKFEGDFFTQLQQTKSLIVGPRCLNSCLLKCEPIPLGSSPVYTTAMRELQISATGITPLEKERLRVLIQWMGGHYFQNFGRSITHLISNTIKSTKYEHATLNGIPVMHVDWVRRVWERSCIANVMATDEEFEKYKLPILYGTNITCTGLDTDKKNEVMRLVNENGGTYHRAFRSQLVDIVITEKSKANSEKYLAAVRYKKEILIPDWIFHSVLKGFALPTKAYQVKTLKVSTPTKTDQSIADFTSTDLSHLSDISRISTRGSKPGGSRAGDATMSETMCSLNETQTPGAAGNTFATPAAPKDLQRAVLKNAGGCVYYRLVYDEICPKQAKKAGTFLDGCCIYLSGFRTEEKEKLNRILNSGGATRYDDVNEKITHIIVGELDEAEFKTWKRDGLLTAVNIVRLDWLLESIKLKQPASEVVYRMSLPTTREPDAPSPSSKKTLRSMNHSFKQPDMPTKKKLFQFDAISTSKADIEKFPLSKLHVELPSEDADEQHLIAQYSQEHEQLPSLPPPTSAAEEDKSMILLNPVASSTQRGSIELPTPASSTPAATIAAPIAAPLQPNPSEMTDAGLSTIDYEHLDFFQGMSVYIDKAHFPEEFYTQMINECEAAQGNVVPETFRDPVDYAIVSFERTLDEKQLPVKARHVITELYVETCMKQNKLMPIEYFHKPIPHSADAMPLEDMTIVISLYSGLERDFVDSLSQLLGAKVNKTFVKKEKPLLVCPSPEGSKYEGALKWRYPVVSSEWLVNCAAEGKKLSYQNYLVGKSSEDFPISPTLRERNVTVAASVTAAMPCEAPTTPVPMETDARENASAQKKPFANPQNSEFTPLRNKRVSELAGPIMRQPLPNTTANSPTPESPHTPTNTFGRYNFDYMEGIVADIENEAERECLREIIDEMRNNQTPELERIRRQACTPINRKIPTPKGIPDFCTTPEFEKRMADAFERRWRLPTKKMKPDTPIDEICRRVMRATCKAMGVPYSNDEGQTSSKDGSSDIDKATTITPVRNSSMAPRTIFVQNASAGNANVSDTFVPDTQSPHEGRHGNVGSIMPGTGPGQRASIIGKSTINFDKISFEETAVGNNSTSSASSFSKQSIAASSPELKQITEYLKNCETRRQSLKQRSVGTRANTDHGVAGDALETDTEAHYVQPFESEQFGAGTEEMVGWRDPAEFSLERRKPALCTMQHKGTPRFSISCTHEETRADLISRILRLGGEVSENLINFDPECTHFVCERPNRGEKMLGCISSGKWVLSLKYVEECSAKGVFIDEELYEWGNSKAFNIPKLAQDELVIASAAHRWRKQLTESGNSQLEENGAFKGFRAILHIPERNLDALKNVIKAGKGQIIEALSPFRDSADAYLATHIFVDAKKMPLTLSDYHFLRENGVHILTQMYINAYLMNGSKVDFAKYEIKM